MNNIADHEARADMNEHRAVCDVRYANIEHKLTDLARKIDDQGVVFHGRLNVISNRVWNAAVGALSLTTLGLSAVVFVLLQRSLK